MYRILSDSDVKMQNAHKLSYLRNRSYPPSFSDTVPSSGGLSTSKSPQEMQEARYITFHGLSASYT